MELVTCIEENICVERLKMVVRPAPVSGRGEAVFARREPAGCCTSQTRCLEHESVWLVTRKESVFL